MKRKFLLFAMLLCATFAVCLTSCGGDKTYAGSYTYDDVYSESTPKAKYGVTVSVTVRGDKIISVSVAEDTDTRYNYTPIWKENAITGDLGAEKAKSAIAGYVKVYEGKSVAEIKGLTVATLDDGTPDKAQKAAWSGYVLTGATQTSGRILLAVQDALKLVEG